MLKTEIDDHLTVPATHYFSRSSNLPRVLGLPLPTGLFYLVLFAAAFWLYSALWPRAPIMAPDSPGYLEVAKDFSDLHIDQLHARPPGYPLFLVLTGSGESLTPALFYASLGLHFISIWLVAVVLCELGLKRVWLNSFAVFLVLPPYVEFAAYVLTEGLSAFLIALGFSSLVLWYLRRGRMHLLLISSASFAYSALTRPTYQALALVIGCFLVAAWRLLPERRLSYWKVIKASLVLVTASVLFVGAYSLLNYVKFNFFGIYTLSGFNLSTRTVKFIERLPDEYAAARETLIKARDAELIKPNSDHTARLSYWNAVPELVKITGLDGPALSKYMLRVNLLLIQKAPLRYLEEVLTSFAGYWLPSVTQLASMDSRALQSLWGVIQLGTVAVFMLQLFVIVGLCALVATQRLLLGKSQSQSDFGFHLSPHHLFAYFLAATIVFYNASLTCLVEIGNPRYRFPTEPLIVFMCFLGAHLWRHLLSDVKSSEDALIGYYPSGTH